MNKTGGECIAIVAYDAGAASHIFSWLKTGLLKIDQCRFCLDGPAAKLFKVIQPQIKIFCLEEVFDNAEKLLSGTGWSSSLEHKARMIAKNKGIKSIAVIDNWGEIRERFVRDHIEVLPDIIWVTDEYTYQEVKRYFSNIDIVEKRNDYIKIQVDEVLSYKIDKQKDTTNVLYVLEPIRESWQGVGQLGEFQALDFFVNSIPNLNFGKNISIILKPHPSESENKYDLWLNSSSLSNITIDNHQNLASLLAWSDVVVGCETYAMVVALELKKRVISSLPRNAHNCRLPFKKIERLNQLNETKYRIK